MTISIMSLSATAICWADIIEYSQTETKSKIILEDRNCRYTLVSLAGGMHIAEHANPRNATVNVTEGQGLLTLESKDLVLQSGVFIFIPANARHAVQGVTNLTFLLTLSESLTDSHH